MATKMPPVPQDNRNPKDAQSGEEAARGSKLHPSRHPERPEQHGGQANIKQNTIAGYQQDR